MPVTQRGQSWQAAVSHKGKRYRKDFGTKAEAERWSAQMKADLLAGRVVEEEKPSGMTIGQLFDRVYEMRWRGSKAEKSSTISGRQVVALLGPDRPVSTITKADALRIKTSLRDRGITDATINRKLSALSVMIKEAIEFGVPVQPFRVGVTKERTGRVRYLSDDEERGLLQWALDMGESEFWDYLVLSIDTGFRQGEVLKIRRRDVTGEGNLWTYDTKNGTSRDVPLTDRASTALMGRLAAVQGGPDTLLFTLKDSALRERWFKAQTYLGLQGDDEFVPHIMRHTFVTRLLANGVDIKTVQELAGHRNITTTQRYAHTSADRKLAAIQKLQGAVA